MEKNVKRKIAWIIIGVMVVGVCLGGVIAYNYYSGFIHENPPYLLPIISFTRNETDSGWNLTVFLMNCEEESIWESQNVIYRLICINGSLWRENGTLGSIKNSPSGYGVRWFDKDNNDRLSVSDVIFISKAGGSSGTVTPGGGYSLKIEVENGEAYGSPHL